MHQYGHMAQRQACHSLELGDARSKLDQLVGPGPTGGRATWVTRVCRWAGGLLGLSQEHGQSVWAYFGHVQECFDSSKPCGNCQRQVRAFAGTPGTSFYTLKHKENQRKERESRIAPSKIKSGVKAERGSLWAITRGVENDPLMVIDHG
ncbi:hypothetical protein Bca52824_072778 [Brassica carinata]|uniref:Uncharacterized protein n=1 Tax=Brassica carinata TaxID=52824 RepID=A0A8X7Q8P1_BRACI|nr:hypothetical protein Bca52824_072778 [Brassica carinata]